MKKYLFTALLVLGLAAAVYAAPVGLTSEADVTESELWADNNIGLSAAFLFDSISNRDIDISDGEMDLNALLARIGLSVMDRFNIYVDAGQMQDMNYDYTITGEKYEAEFEDALMWGVGANALVYRWDNGLEVGAGASYRQAEMNLEQVAIDNVVWSKSNIITANNGDFSEIQGAVELAWKTEYFMPYIGVKYSDVEVDSKFTLNDGVDRDASGKNATENFGFFTGLTIVPKIDALPNSERLTINVEGRFIDEEAVSASVAYKF